MKKKMLIHVLNYKYCTPFVVSGTVKWVGVLHEESIAPELYVGVRLDDNGIISFLFIVCHG